MKQNKKKTLGAFTYKEFLHIWRDKWTLLIIIGIPITLLLLLGFAITTEVRNVDIAVFDPSNDEITTKIIDRIDQSQYFNVRERISDIDRVNNIFREGKVSLVLVFSEDFSANAVTGDGAGIQLLLDGTDPNQAAFIDAYVSSIIRECQSDLAREAGVTAATITPTVRMLYNPQSKSAFNFVPGIMALILMLICAMMTAIAIVREKESGSMEILLASPIKPINILIAKAIPYLTLSLVDLGIILVCSVFILKVPIVGSLWALIGLSVIFLLCALCLGLLISTAAKTQMSAMVASGMGLMMPTMLLSGIFFPIESMPKILQVISTIVPARWYAQAVKVIMIQGAPIQYTTHEVLILTLMTVVLLLAALKSFKTRLA